MRLTILYAADGTQEQIIEGYRITQQLFPDGRALIRVYDESGKVTDHWHFSRVYYMHREC